MAGTCNRNGALLLAIVFAAGEWAPCLAADEGRTVTPDLSLADLIEQTEPSCVRVDVTGRTGTGIGSGFVVAQPNWIVTNYHVVVGASSAAVTFSDGSKADVEGFLAYGEQRDLVILQIKGDSKRRALTLASKLPRKGESVVAIGSPQGLSFTASEGIISAIRDGKELQEFGKTAVGTWIQTSTPISPGSSGGPLLNLRGEIVGANTGSLASAQNLNFAISSADIEVMLGFARKARRVEPLSKITTAATAGREGRGSTAPRQTRRPQQESDDPPQLVKLPAKRRFSHRFRIQEDEDKFDQVKWLRTEWMALRHREPRLSSCALRVSVPYQEDSPSPAVVWELGTTSEHFLFVGTNRRDFQLLVDNKSVDAGRPAHQGEVKPGSVAENLTTYLTLAGFLELIEAKSVEARVGTLEFALAADQLECLRDLASRLPTGKTPQGNVTVERHELTDDPTAPPSAKRTKRSPGPVAATTPGDYRIWTSADGKFRVEAQLVKVADGMVRLRRKQDGREITVPLDRLSPSDQSFVGK